MNKLTKFIGVTMLVLFFVGAIANHYAAELSIWYMKNVSATRDKVPQAYLVPVNRPLPVADMRDNKGQEKCLGLTFRTNWGTPAARSVAKSSIELTYSGSRKITVIKNAGLACFILAYVKAGNQQYIDVAGDEQNAYGVVKPILEVTPVNIQSFGPREEINRQNARLIFKIVNIPKCENIYRLVNSNVDVLEFYGHNGEVRGAVADVADNKGHFYQVLISDPNVNQAEVEQMLSTMKIEAK
ncbi:MAG: hypothetical protein ACM3PP_06590 [Candidatus Saccharibacteria bacterium]